MKVFSTYISLKTNYRCPTKDTENSHLQAERRALEDILANSTDGLLAVSFGKTFHTLYQWVYRVRFFLENHDFFPIALIDGMIPIFHAFLNDNGHFTSMNGAR